MIWKKKQKIPREKRKYTRTATALRIILNRFQLKQLLMRGALFDWSIEFVSNFAFVLRQWVTVTSFLFSRFLCSVERSRRIVIVDGIAAIGDHQVTRLLLDLIRDIVHIDKPKVDEGCKACRFGWYEPLLRRRYRFYRYTVRESVGQEKFSFNFINENQQMK